MTRYTEAELAELERLMARLADTAPEYSSLTTLANDYVAARNALPRLVAELRAAYAAIDLLNQPLDFYGDEQPTEEQLKWFRIGLNAQCTRMNAALDDFSAPAEPKEVTP